MQVAVVVQGGASLIRCIEPQDCAFVSGKLFAVGLTLVTFEPGRPLQLLSRQSLRIDVLVQLQRYPLNIRPLDPNIYYQIPCSKVRHRRPLRQMRQQRVGQEQ